MTQDELKFLDALSTFKNILVFSPHFDDCILSMGSLLIALVGSKNIKVVNVFTKGSKVLSPLNQKLIKQAQISNTKDYFLERRNEDKRAFEKLGNISIKNLGFIDAAWRVGQDKYPLYTQTALGEVHPDDRQLGQLVENQIKKLQDNLSNTIIFAPLARGRHVDHQIVRNSVTNVFNKTIYYSDFPYANKYENEDKFIKEHQLSEIVWQGDYTKKKEAILTYKSQMVSLSNMKGFRRIPEMFFFR